TLPSLTASIPSLVPDKINFAGFLNSLSSPLTKISLLHRPPSTISSLSNLYIPLPFSLTTNSEAFIAIPLSFVNLSFFLGFLTSILPLTLPEPLITSTFGIQHNPNFLFPEPYQARGSPYPYSVAVSITSRNTASGSFS